MLPLCIALDLSIFLVGILRYNSIIITLQNTHFCQAMCWSCSCVRLRSAWLSQPDPAELSDAVPIQYLLEITTSRLSRISFATCSGKSFLWRHRFRAAFDTRVTSLSYDRKVWTSMVDEHYIITHQLARICATNPPDFTCLPCIRYESI
jgi:hypothetical protein